MFARFAYLPVHRIWATSLSVLSTSKYALVHVAVRPLPIYHIFSATLVLFSALPLANQSFGYPFPRPHSPQALGSTVSAPKVPRQRDNVQTRS